MAAALPSLALIVAYSSAASFTAFLNAVLPNRPPTVPAAEPKPGPAVAEPRAKPIPAAAMVSRSIGPCAPSTPTNHSTGPRSSSPSPISVNSPENGEFLRMSSSARSMTPRPYSSAPSSTAPAPNKERRLAIPVSKFSAKRRPSVGSVIDL